MCDFRVIQRRHHGTRKRIPTFFIQHIGSKSYYIFSFSCNSDASIAREILDETKVGAFVTDIRKTTRVSVNSKEKSLRLWESKRFLGA